MAAPLSVSFVALEDVLELSLEQLKIALESLYLEAQGLSKPQMLKALSRVCRYRVACSDAAANAISFLVATANGNRGSETETTA